METIPTHIQRISFHVTPSLDSSTFWQYSEHKDSSKISLFTLSSAGAVCWMCITMADELYRVVANQVLYSCGISEVPDRNKHFRNLLVRPCLRLSSIASLVCSRNSLLLNYRPQRPVVPNWNLTSCHQPVLLLCAAFPFACAELHGVPVSDALQPVECPNGCLPSSVSCSLGSV